MRMIRTRWMHRLLVAVLIASLLPVLALPAGAQDGGIDQGALLHDSRDDLYRTPGGAVPTETPVTLRFRTAAGDVDSVAVNVYNWVDDAQALLPMQIANTTPDGYDIWEATVDTGRKPTIIRYRFLVRQGDETLYYEDDTRPPDGTSPFVAANEGGTGIVYATSPDLTYQITVYDPEFYTPEWMRNAVVYQIFPDRFRNGDTANDPADNSDTFYGELPLYFHETWNEPPLDGRTNQAPSGAGYYNSDFFGGDLAGIIEKLDYLQSLGVTAIYLNPVFEARSNHRYDTADFKAVDPLLGDMDTFETLVSEAEARGMVLILDAVFNHMSSDGEYFDRYHRFPESEGACESLRSPWRDWFFFVAPRGNQPAACVDDGQGNTYYTSWAGYDSIPKINNDQLEPRKYFFLDEDSVARQWGAAGIGGWRLDVAGDIDSGGPGTVYWEPFRSVVRQVNPEGVIIGEEWADASPWLLGKEWDSVMNYRLRTAILGFARDEAFFDNDSNGDRVIYALSPTEVNNLIRAIEEDYPPMAYHAMMNLLGSHDTSRAYFVLENDPGALALAALLQFTLPGAPMVYYGDEIAINAPSIPDSGGNLQDDPFNRAPYPWADESGSYYASPNVLMLAYYRQIAALRHANSALREGDMITLLTDDAAGVYAFLRVDATAGNAALVVLNNGDAAQSVTLDLGGLLPGDLTLQPLFGATTLTTGGDVTVSVGAMQGNVWTVTAEAPFAAPDAPANLAAQGEDGGVILTWDAVEGAAGYMVYRSPVASGGFEPIGMADEAGLIDESTVNGYRYYYSVAAVGADGLVGEMSASALAIPSAPISAAFYVGDEAAGDAPAVYEPTVVALTIGVTTTLEAGVRVEGMTEAEGPADGMRAEAAMVSSVDDLAAADWLPMTYSGEADGADLYSVTFAPQTPGDYLTVARFSTTAGETWTLVAYRDNTFPQLIVEASSDTTAPDAPADVRIRRASLSGVIVEWDAPAADDLYAYRIYRTDEDGATEQLSEVLADTTRYTDKAVSEGATFTYSVSAVDTSLNESELGAAEAVEVQKGVVPVVFNLTVPDTTPEGDQIFLAGALGAGYPNWNPAGLEMTQVDATHWTLTLDLPEGANIEYKFVRNGDWLYVEKDAECGELANRKLNVVYGEESDELVVEHEVAKWRDIDACG